VLQKEQFIMLVSVIVSFRNEEANISELVRRVSDAVNRIEAAKLEMIFVNDCSTDDSVRLLTELQNIYPITIINMSRRFGVIPCIMAGLKHAKGDCAINIEADLQDPPEIIPDMVQKWLAGAAVVHTTRTHRDGESAAKMWITKWAYKTINYFSEISLPENTGNYKLLSRRAIDKMLSMPEKDPYFRGMSVWLGFRQDFVLFRREPRFAGESQRGLLSGAPAREFFRGLTAFSAKPLYISFFLGLVTCLIAVAVVVYAIVAKIMGVSALGSSGILIAMAFFSGIVMMTNGVIGLYVAKIYYEVKGRPQYIIDNVIEADTNRDD
jgi:glycosyltransferase involved in cell wall biosynthesis